MTIYSAVAIDYSKGLNITDPQTGKVYTDQEAHEQPKDVRSRLVMRGKKIGAQVMTVSECQEIHGW